MTRDCHVRFGESRGVRFPSATHQHTQRWPMACRASSLHMHFTPTYSSRLHQVERWFGLLTDKKLRRGTHTSVAALGNDLRDGIKTWNRSPGPKPPTKSSTVSGPPSRDRKTGCARDRGGARSSRRYTKRTGQSPGVWFSFAVSQRRVTCYYFCV